MPVSPNLIADAAVAAIEALALDDDLTVVKRKTPSLPDGTEPPCVVVVVGEGGEEGQTEPISATKKVNRYPVTVVIITAGGNLADDETIREWRDQIEDALDDRARTTFSTVTGLNVVNTIGKAPFDGALIPRDLNYSAQTFNVEVIESRST